MVNLPLNWNVKGKSEKFSKFRKEDGTIRPRVFDLGEERVRYFGALLHLLQQSSVVLRKTRAAVIAA